MSFIIAIATILTAGGGLGSALVGPVAEKLDPNEVQPLQTRSTPTPVVQAQLIATATMAPPPPPPPGAQPVGAVDLAIRQLPQGIAGAEPGEVSCDSPGLMRIQTSGGTLLAGISEEGGWSCQVSLSQWRTVVQQDGDVGVRYVPSDRGQPGNVTLVNGAGRSFSMNVTGAWSLQ